MSRGTADRIEIVTHEAAPRDVLAIGIPSFGMVHLYFMSRIYNLRMPMNRVVRWFYIIGREVGEARNEIAARALAIGADGQRERCSRLLFIDDDLLLHPDAALKLLADERPIVSGLYYTKTTVPSPLVLHGEFEGTAREWTPGELVECQGHGMGLCLLDADVLRRMRDELPLGLDRNGHPNWFTTIKDSQVLRPDGVPAFYNSTEDWQFLAKARALGYQPCVDTSAQTFAWHLDTRTMNVYPEAQWAEYARAGTITWPMDNGKSVVWDTAA